jgi:hypothetical protein
MYSTTEIHPSRENECRTSWHFVWLVDDSHSARVARPLLVS